MKSIEIIGMGQGKEDLTQKHLNIIKKCEVLVGGKRQLALFNLPGVEKIPITGHIDTIIKTIKDKMDQAKIVVLASGDPLFYGIGSTLTRYFDKKYLKIHSNISSISAAFAAIKEPWHDAEIISLHGKHSKEIAFSKLREKNKLAFLTDPEMDPEFIAAGLIKEGMSDFKFCVIEQLGDKNKKKITWFKNIDQVKEQTFSQPNIVILLKRKEEKVAFPHETHMGMLDSLFKHSNGLITKSEIRSITLSKLKFIKKNHIFWDIGSGSGSISIEASLQIPWGHVYAFEKHPERISDIVHNIKAFNCTNIEVHNTAFPKGIQNLDTPDRIFIGGGGEHLGEIIKVACDRLAPCGVIVINTVLIQNLETALQRLKEYNLNPQMIQVQVSRSKGMPFGDRLEALNPVWIISGTKANV